MKKLRLKTKRLVIEPMENEEIENFVKLHVKTEIAINIEITEETYDKMQRRIVFYNVKSDGKLYMEKGDFIANENNSIKLYNSENFFKTYKEV